MSVNRGKAERGLREFPRLLRPRIPVHMTRREGDETACSCGARWPAGEPHP